MRSWSETASGEKTGLFAMRDRSTNPVLAGVNSVSARASVPCALSTMADETPRKAPVSESASAPTHRPPRAMCS